MAFPAERPRRLRRTDRDPNDTFEPKEKCVDIALATSMLFNAAMANAYDVAIADLSSIAQDQLHISTGRTGNTDFSTCGDFTSFNDARYGVATGTASESYAKSHWSSDPGSGKKNSCFGRSGGSDSCTVDGVTYYVYDVQVP